MRIRSAISLLLFSFWLPVAAWAQGGATGAISGVVEDQSSAVVPRAHIDISGVAGTVRHLESDASGNFTAPLPPAGTYTILVIAPGFAETRISSVGVRVTETTRLTAVLRPRSLETSTAVTGQSLSARISRIPHSSILKAPRISGRLPVLWERRA